MKKDLEVRQDKMTVEWSGKAAGLFASVDVHLCSSDFQHLQCSSSQLNTLPPITFSNKMPELNAFHSSERRPSAALRWILKMKHSFLSPRRGYTGIRVSFA